MNPNKGKGLIMKKHVRLISVLSVLLASQASLFAAAPALNDKLLEKGKASYAANCLVCHGAAGDGNGPAGAALNPKPRNFIKDAYKKGDKVEQVFESISKGLDGTGMVGFSHLPEEDRWGLSYYVLSFNPKNTKKSKAKK